MGMANNSRRTFLKGAGAGWAAAALGSSASSYANMIGANDRVRVGVVAYSDRSRSALVPAFQQHAQELNFELNALSDIWKQRLEEGAAHLQQVTGKPIAAARNNEELYERKDVDAVIVATADFQHAQHGVQAVTAERDAYIENPPANAMSDARAHPGARRRTRQNFQIA